MDVKGMTRPEIILRETANAQKRVADQERHREKLARKAAEEAEADAAQLLAAADLIHEAAGRGGGE